MKLKHGLFMSGLLFLTGNFLATANSGHSEHQKQARAGGKGGKKGLAYSYEKLLKKFYNVTLYMRYSSYNTTEVPFLKWNSTCWEMRVGPPEISNENYTVTVRYLDFKMQWQNDTGTVREVNKKPKRQSEDDKFWSASLGRLVFLVEHSAMEAHKGETRYQVLGTDWKSCFALKNIMTSSQTLPECSIWSTDGGSNVTIPPNCTKAYEAGCSSTKNFSAALIINCTEKRRKPLPFC